MLLQFRPIRLRNPLLTVIVEKTILATLGLTSGALWTVASSFYIAIPYVPFVFLVASLYNYLVCSRMWDAVVEQKDEGLAAEDDFLHPGFTQLIRDIHRIECIVLPALFFAATRGWIGNSMGPSSLTELGSIASASFVTVLGKDLIQRRGPSTLRAQTMFLSLTAFIFFIAYRILICSYGHYVTIKHPWDSLVITFQSFSASFVIMHAGFRRSLFTQVNQDFEKLLFRCALHVGGQSTGALLGIPLVMTPFIGVS